MQASGLDDVVVRFVGDFRSTDREWADAGIGDRIELIPYAPHRRSLELQRDSEALLLLIPEAGGRGNGVLCGKVFEYLAAERPILAVVPPDGAAADLIRNADAGVVVAPDDIDGIAAALRELRERWRAGGLEQAPLGAGVEGPRLAPGSRAGAGRSAREARVRRLTSFLFLATVFCCTFEKVHWNAIGTVGLADVLALLFLAAFALTTRSWCVPRTTAVVLGFLGVFLVVYLAGFYNLDSSDQLAQWTKGLIKFVIHFTFLAAATICLARRGRAYYWRALGWFSAGMAFNALYGVLQLLDARRGGNLDATLISPLTGGSSQINTYGVVNGASVFRPNALTGDPNHLGIMLIVPLLILSPIYLRLEPGHRLRRPLMALIGFLLVVEAATLSRSGLLGLGVGALILAVPYRRFLYSRALLVPVGAAVALLLAVVLSRRHFFSVVLRSRVETGGSSENAHFQVYSFIPNVLHSHPLLGLGSEHVLGLLRVRHRQVELGAALLLRGTARRDGRGRRPPVRDLPRLGVPPSARRARARPLTRGCRRSARRPHPSAGLGLYRRPRRDPRVERLLPDDAVLLLLRLPRLRALDPGGLRARSRVKVVVLTTSYPRGPDDVAGRFVADAVERARAAGVTVEVVSPATFPSFGIGYGAGIVQNLRAAPWKLALTPAFVAAYARAARRAARDADLVHAHWIPSALAARATGKPYVLQVWGTDVALARRAPRLARRCCEAPGS